MLSKRVTVSLLIIVLAAGMSVRIVTANWGLPNEAHYHSYNADEGMNLYMFSHFRPKELRFDPNYYVSGTLGYYMLSAAVFSGRVFGLYPIVGSKQYYKDNIGDLRNMYLAQRLFIVLVSTLLIFVAFHIGLVIEGERLGLLMAAFTALMPGILVISQYCTHDMIVVFFLTVSFLFLARYVSSGKTSNLYLLALFCGFSFSTKHSGAFSVVFLFYALYLLRKNGARNWLSMAVRLFTLMALAFAVTSPYLLKFRLTQLLNPELVADTDAPSGFYWNLSWDHIATYSVRILRIYFLQVGIGIVALLYLVRAGKHSRYVIPLLLFVACFHGAVLMTGYGFDWRLLPNAYFIGLLSMIGLYKLLANGRVPRVLKYVAALAVSAWLIVYAVEIKHRFLRTDNRVAASRWIEEHILTDPHPRIGVNKPPGYSFPDIVTREWQQANDATFAHFPNRYDEEFIVPSTLLNWEAGGHHESSGISEIQWMISQSPDYIVLARRPDEAWHKYLADSKQYTLAKHFKKYDRLLLSHLAMLSFDIYIYKRTANE